MNRGGPSAHGQKSIGRDPDTLAGAPESSVPEPISFGPLANESGPAALLRDPGTATGGLETVAAVVRRPDAVVPLPDAVVRRPDAVVPLPDAVVRRPVAVVRDRDALVRDRDVLVRDPERDASGPETPANGPERAVRDRDVANPPTMSQDAIPVALRRDAPTSPAEVSTTAARTLSSVSHPTAVTMRKLEADTMRKPSTATPRKPGDATTRTAAKLQKAGKSQKADVDLARVKPRYATVFMSHALAADWLRDEGLRTHSSGHCTNKQVYRCTSLEDVRTSTISRVIGIKRQSGCPVMVTGGTEAGHAPGPYSHGNGYKLDITHNPCIDRYITKNHEKSGTRGDGAALYRSPSGTVFADEVDHWDILFR
ncbi:hypothetical protein ACQP2T_62745 [Nonomuraea sp. CA-143628]|uniref:hypothetical protein n=1 Tax=Nonomuraea sp. CA-143628 TaxID=3239997 RepID=UPI003D92CE25